MIEPTIFDGRDTSEENLKLIQDEYEKDGFVVCKILNRRQCEDLVSRHPHVRARARVRGLTALRLCATGARAVEGGD